MVYAHLDFSLYNINTKMSYSNCKKITKIRQVTFNIYSHIIFIKTWKYEHNRNSLKEKLHIKFDCCFLMTL